MVEKEVKTYKKRRQFIFLHFYKKRSNYSTLRRKNIPSQTSFFRKKDGKKKEVYLPEFMSWTKSVVYVDEFEGAK